MKQRKISRADIEHALRNHHSSWTTQQGSIQYEGPGVDGRTLKVWLKAPGFVDAEARMIVKSVAWKD